ncbi:MAG: outer-membrane lipoprotein carrier protein LolA, partial [Burkholderiales bacterium]|nr:outer-membrane lipoprotein carrier protein LolA [Burkholderiales bacterium]
GQRIWFYDKDLNQATVRRLSDSLASTPAAILFGDADLEHEFALRELAPRDGLEWVEALPRSREAGFERIALGMRDGLPVTMEVADAFGRTTVFGFRDIVRNASPAPEWFRYVPPKGVDVVEQ